MPKNFNDPLPLALWDAPPDPDRFERLRKRQQDVPVGGIRLANNVSSGDPVYLRLKQLTTHMHVLGSTGVGKSFFLEAMIKQLIHAGQGVCLIDPNGDLYHRVLDYCAYLNQQEPERHLERRVIPFDIAESEYILGFNPAARNARVMTYQVLALIEAIRKVWGQDSFEDTPRLARWLYNTAYGVIDPKLTLLQAEHLLNPKPNVQRLAIVDRISSPMIAGEWQWLSEMRDDKRNEFIESSYNRVRVFLQHEVLRLILGQQRRTIDFTSVLGERKILLVNLAQQNVIPKDFQHLLGTLLVNELLTAAFARPQGQRTPFYLFIDEFGNFVTKDMCEILDAGRKFGLHLILAHQHLDQLKQKDPEVYYSVMTNARTKAVFGGLSEEDLSILGPELFNRELDPDQVKDEIWQTKFEPVESSRIIVADSASETRSESFGHSYGAITHQSLTRGDTYIPGSYFLSPQPWSLPDSTSIQKSGGTSRSSGQQTTTGSGYSSSSTSSEVPWYEYHKFREVSSREFRSLEEQLFMKIAQLKDQDTQHLALLVPRSLVQWGKVLTLRDFSKLIKDRDRRDFLRVCFETAGCFASPEDALREISGLEEQLLVPEAVRASSVIPVTPELQESPQAVAEIPKPKKKRATRRKAVSTNLFDTVKAEDE